jgi:O-antigen ligase
MGSIKAMRTAPTGRFPRRARDASIAAGASLIAAYSAFAMPILVRAMVGAGVAAWLVVTSVENFVFLALLGRNFADAVAYRPLLLGLNLGGLLGLLVLGVVAVRLTAAHNLRALGACLSVGVLLALWTTVGYFNYGFSPDLTRELIRGASILAIALVVANAPPGRHLRVVDAALLAACLPAFVAIQQGITGDGFEDGNRAYGTLSHPSTAGAVFAVCLAVAIWRYLEDRGGGRYLLLGVLFALALLATRSLGAMAQMLVTLMAYGFLRNTGGMRGRVVAVAGVALVLVFTLSPVGSERIEELQTTTSFTEASQGYNTNSLDWRFTQWSKLLDEWREQPWVGHGLGTTGTFVSPQNNIPHNDWLRMLVETGVVGTVIFTTAFFVLLARLMRRTRDTTASASFHAVVLAIVFGLAINGTANNMFSQTAPMYLASALVGASVAAAAARGVTSSRRQ